MEKSPLRVEVVACHGGRSDSWLGEATAADHQAAALCRRQERGRQRLLGRVLLRQLLWRHAGIAAADWQFRTDEDGRPWPFGPDGAMGPAVSLSHSGPWLAAALAARGRIGVDVEAARPGRSLTGLAQAYFHPCEQATAALAGEAGLLACWTLREALAKAMGGGVAGALSLDGSALVGAQNASAVVDLDGCRWAVAHRGDESLQLALAWSAEEAGAEGAVATALAAAWASIQSAT